MSPSEDILYGVEGGVALITLNRPDRLNAWSPAMQKSFGSNDSRNGVVDILEKRPARFTRRR